MSCRARSRSARWRARSASASRGDLAAGYRSAARWECPRELRLGRERVREHVAFGRGSHVCAGAPLARLEAQIAIETMLRRLPDLRLSVPADSLRWRKSLIMRGLVKLPVEF